MSNLALKPQSNNQWQGLSLTNRQWRARVYNPRDVETMIQQQGLNRALAECLSARNIKPEDAHDFLHPSLKSAMPDPLVLAGMEKAVERIRKAIKASEKIAIFGDYDVDGTSSAALLTRYFLSIGIEPLIHLPDRFMEGYGPNSNAFKALQVKGAKLVITVDCGAMAHDVLDQAKADGLDVVVLDHHQMSLPLPPAAAVVNPNRPDDISGLQSLSAAGVSFMTLVGLNRALREEGFFENRPAPNLLEYLDLTALGLVCDIMPLAGLTRVLVAQGLKVLGQFEKPEAARNGLANKAFPGLHALAELAGASGPASAYHLGFVLGPRINAAGRIGHANLAYALMIERDPEQARKLAAQLHNLNAERQEIEAEVLQQAVTQIGEDPKSALIIAAEEGWHIGVIGIVAGRLKEKYQRPALTISFNNGIGKASGRSIKGVDLGAAITVAVQKGLLLGGGGHAMACGFTIEQSRLADFTAFMEAHLAEQIAGAEDHLHLEIDGQISAAGVNRDFCDQLAMAAPFGAGHAEPVFALDDMQIQFAKPVGKDHIACTLQDRTGTRVRAIAFRVAETPLGDALMAAAGDPLQRFSIAGKIKPDDWRGGQAAQMIIEDLLVTHSPENAPPE